MGRKPFRTVKLVRGKITNGRVTQPGNVLMLDNDVRLSIGRKTTTISKGKRKEKLPTRLLFKRSAKPRFHKAIRKVRGR